ncbi:MAG: LysR family transcriptional regulator [Betaproteobacteria bacterium]
MNLRKYDLNLLVVLDALLDEANVTRAGRRVHLSQSATSGALERLRKMFGDPLLMRVEGRMELTLFAQELRAPLKQLLISIDETILRPDNFDPATSVANFRIGMTDYLGLLLLPGLQAQLSEQAPGVHVEVVPVTQEAIANLLERDGIHVAGMVAPQRRPQILHKKLLDETFSFVCRRGHPAGQLPLDLAALLAHPHVNVLAHGAGTVDAALGALGAARNIALTVPYFAAAFALLKSSDMVAVLPSRLARSQARNFGLELHALPIDVPGYSIELAWHLRTNNHAAHAWFREMMMAAAA